MKLNFIFRTLFTATAFAPASFVYALVWFSQERYLGGCICIAAGVFLVLGGLGIASQAKKTLPSLPYTAKQVETADSEIIGFLLIYLLPLMTDDYSTTNWFLWILIAVVFCWLVAASYGYYFNPVLSMFGWHYFKTTDDQGRTSVLITKKRLYDPNTQLLVGKIAEYVLIEKDSDPI